MKHTLTPFVIDLALAAYLFPSSEGYTAVTSRLEVLDIHLILCLHLLPSKVDRDHT